MYNHKNDNINQDRYMFYSAAHKKSMILRYPHATIVCCYMDNVQIIYY